MFCKFHGKRLIFKKAKRASSSLFQAYDSDSVCNLDDDALDDDDDDTGPTD